MRGRGRTRSNWRTAAANAPQNEVPPPDCFTTESSNAMEFNYEGLPEQSADVHCTDSDASMQEGDMQEPPPRKRPWERAGGKFGMKRKRAPNARNLRIRRMVQPKNAVMCLNELKPGLVYTTEQEGGGNKPYCVSVEIGTEGETQKFRGFGSSKMLAKQAAAEAALISFVKPPLHVTGEEEDKTPWATLASFAIYKLFNDWREGRVGMCPPPAVQPYGTALSHGGKLNASDTTGFQALMGNATAGGTGVKEESAQASAFTEVINAHLLVGGKEPKSQSLAADKVPKPARQMPDNAAAMHPVMVLHQMRPGLQYNIITNSKDKASPSFTVTAEVEGKTFTGNGQNVKKAKFILAKEAIQVLYGIQSTFEPKIGATTP